MLLQNQHLPVMTAALLGAMAHAATLADSPAGPTTEFLAALRAALHQQYRCGQGTRDMVGPTGVTTEALVRSVAECLCKYLQGGIDQPAAQPAQQVGRSEAEYDMSTVDALFQQFDADGDGLVGLAEFKRMMVDLGVAPKSPDKVARDLRRRMAEL